MRKILNGFYLACALLAAASLVGMVLLVLMQIVIRFLGTYIPSSDDISGYLVAWTTYLGLAYTLNQNSHIRVELFLNFLSTKNKKYLNILVNIAGTILISLFLYNVFFIVKEAYDYGDMTQGLLAMPLWMVQMPYLFGVFGLWVALVDRTWGSIFVNDPNQNNEQKKSFSETVS